MPIPQSAPGGLRLREHLVEERFDPRQHRVRTGGDVGGLGDVREDLAARSVTATSTLVAPRSATSRWPASAQKRSLRGARPPVDGPDPVLRDQAVPRERRQPLRDHGPAEPARLGERATRTGTVPPDVIQDLDEPGRNIVEGRQPRHPTQPILRAGRPITSVRL